MSTPLYLVLYYPWVINTTAFPDGRQRLQVTYIHLIIAGAATRPGALVYVRRSEELVKGCNIGESNEKHDDTTKGCNESDSDWDNLTVYLTPNPDNIRDLLAIEVDIYYTKGHYRKL